MWQVIVDKKLAESDFRRWIAASGAVSSDGSEWMVPHSEEGSRSRRLAQVCWLVDRNRRHARQHGSQDRVAFFGTYSENDTRLVQRCGLRWRGLIEPIQKGKYRTSKRVFIPTNNRVTPQRYFAGAV